MTREQLLQYVLDRYGTLPDSPWADEPTYQVLRQSDGKWYGLIMNIPPEKLGLPAGEPINVLNVKCDPLLIGAMRQEKGVFPAWHMNREHWLTAALPLAADETILQLLEISRSLTAPKPKKPRPKSSRPPEMW